MTKRIIWNVCALFILVTAPSGFAQAMHIPVSCNIVGKADAGQGEQACADVLKILQSSKPGMTFEIGAAKAKPNLEVLIHTATSHGASVQMNWHSARGEIHRGERLSIVMADRVLSHAQRQSLYHRAIAALPELK